MPTTMKITTPGETRGPVFAYLFDDDGDLLERAEVTDGAVKLRASKAKVLAGRLLLAPDIGEEATPSILERARAFEPLLGRDSIPDVVTVPDSIIAHWPWCICLIKGRVERADGRPVCDARVHICEVDAIPQLIARLPDHDIVRLRDDLLVAVREPVIPIPIPEPRPFPDPFPMPQPGLAGTRDLTIGTRPDFRVDGPDIGRVTRPGVSSGGAAREAGDDFRRAAPDATLRATEIDPQVRRQLTSQAVPTVRKALAAQPHLILPWLCRWRWLWPWLRCDEIAVVETGDGGEFQRLYFHDCSDTPDLYFWVEFDFGDGWETVHRPPMPCNVHWNHDCSDEIVVTVNDPRVPTCAGTPTGNHDVNILSLGNGVAVREVQDATGGPATEGLTTAGEPFGATIEPRVDFAPSLDGSSTSFYRWSARRLSGPDGVDATAPTGSVAIGAWFPLTRTVVRHYREQTSAGTSYPALTLGPLPSSTAPAPNLFQIPPVMTPAGDAQWRVLDQHEDLASAHFETASLMGSPGAATDTDLAAGRYELKLELFDAAGDLVNWTDAGIEVGITDQDAPFGTGTVTTSPAPSGNRILDGDGDTIGFRMVIRVDNNRCSATVRPPAGDLTLDGCGFHEYAQPSDKVGLSFDAGHPNALATWSFRVVRGTESPAQVPVDVGGDVGQSGPGDWTLSGQTHSNSVISVGDLLGSCPRAAFSQALYVRTRAQNGYGRLSGYDAFGHGGFALVAED
ncbi:MAG TPA: hypothetical protein VJ978_15435 [Nitriliruptoraceae bacterium]|nr:hypothetical protein [Nitriliruptoraceae bacterium]